MEGQGNHTFQVFGIGLTTYHIGSRHANSQAECDNVLINIMFIVIKASFHFQTHDFTAQCQQKSENVADCFDDHRAFLLCICPFAM